MRIFAASAALWTALCLASPAGAQGSGAAGVNAVKPEAPVQIRVTNSAKDIEILTAKLLKEQLKLESSLKLVDGNPDNMRLDIPIGADKKQGIPRLLAIIDTAVVAQDEDGNVISQTISIAATADIQFDKEQLPTLLQWVNAWNAQMIPIRVFIANKRVYTGVSVLATVTEPASADRIIGSFLGVVSAWSAVMRDLRANRFVPER